MFRQEGSCVRIWQAAHLSGELESVTYPIVNLEFFVFGGGEPEFFGRQHPIRWHNQLQSNYGSADPACLPWHASQCRILISYFRGNFFRCFADNFKAPHKCTFDCFVLIKLVFVKIAHLFFTITGFVKNMTKVFKRRE